MTFICLILNLQGCKVIYDIKVKNPYKYEKIIHNKLSKFRENKNREFFRCTPNDIIDYFKIENLISSEYDKNDFCENYFNQYSEKEQNMKNTNSRIHSDTFTNVSKNECNICGKSFRYNYLLLRHKNGKLSCNKSNKIIENYNNKIIDIDTKLDDLYQLSMESKIKCYYCDNDYNNKSNLRRHILSYCEERQQLLDDKDKYMKIVDNKKKEEEININANKEILEYKKIIANLQKKINNSIIISGNKHNVNNVNNVNNVYNIQNIDNSENIDIKILLI